MATRVKTIEKITNNIIQINKENYALWCINAKFREKNEAINRDVCKTIEKNKKAIVYFGREVSRLKKIEEEDIKKELRRMTKRLNATRKMSIITKEEMEIIKKKNKKLTISSQKKNTEM